jgi:hypothetical protein
MCNNGRGTTKNAEEISRHEAPIKVMGMCNKIITQIDKKTAR